MLAPAIPFIESLLKRLSGSSGLKPRLSTRLAMEEPVRLVVGTAQGLPAILQDVSAGGACLRTHQPLRVGERIGLGMRFGLHQRYDIPARVVYANSGACGSHARYGVKFVWISAEERRRLDAFVTECVNARKLGIRSFASLPAGRGFTIVEALIAMVVLLFIILTLVSIVPSTFQFASRESIHIQAATAAQQYLDAPQQNRGYRLGYDAGLEEF